MVLEDWALVVLTLILVNVVPYIAHLRAQRAGLRALLRARDALRAKTLRFHDDD